MVRMHALPDDAALAAISEGDFPTGTLGEGNAAVVMTQHWCPDWLGMKRWLEKAERDGTPADLDIDVYVLVYNRVDYYEDFLRFKEESFGSRLIPYVRYYAGGRFVGESHQVSRDGFFAAFR